MSTAKAADDSSGAVATARPFSLSLPAPWWQRGVLGLTLAAVFAVIGYVAATEYPDASPPQGTELEAKIAGHESRVNELEDGFTRAAVYLDAAKMKAGQEEVARLKTELASLEEEWLTR